LVAGLAGLAKAMPPERAAGLLADVLVKRTFTYRSEWLVSILVEAAKALPSGRAAEVLIDAGARYPAQLVPALRELASRAPFERKVEWLKRPLCYGETRQAILSQIKAPDGTTFRSHWELVEWLQKNRPDINLTSPPMDTDRSSQP
jgi:hypothetical protein